MCVSEEACILVNFQNLPFNLPSQQIDPCFYFLSLFFSFFLGKKKRFGCDENSQDLSY